MLKITSYGKSYTVANMFAVDTNSFLFAQKIGQNSDYFVRFSEQIVSIGKNNGAQFFKFEPSTFFVLFLIKNKMTWFIWQRPFTKSVLRYK